MSILWFEQTVGYPICQFFASGTITISPWSAINSNFVTYRGVALVTIPFLVLRVDLLLSRPISDRWSPLLAGLVWLNVNILWDVLTAWPLFTAPLMWEAAALPIARRRPSWLRTRLCLLFTCNRLLVVFCVRSSLLGPFLWLLGSWFRLALAYLAAAPWIWGGSLFGYAWLLLNVWNIYRLRQGLGFTLTISIPVFMNLAKNRSF
jgi:hypothetical protein